MKAALIVKRRRLLRNLRAAAGTLLVGMFVIGNATVAGGAAAAAGTDPTRTKIVALGFDAGSGTLMKAYAGALYRSNSSRSDWQRLALPDTIKLGRIAAISIAAKGATLYIAGPGIGVLRSVDDGRSWIAKNDGLPTRNIVALSSHAEQPQTVYVYATGHGIFRSQDAGDHWRLMDAGPRENVVQFVHSNMPGSMETGWLFAATAKGVIRSMDCFCGWRDAGALAHGVNAVAFDPKETKRVHAATSEALFVSADGGEHLPAPVFAADIPVKIYRNPSCGCCDAYAAYLKKNGFSVEVVDTLDAASIHRKYNVPEQLEGCHTAVIGNHVFEGLIPAEYVKRVVNENRPIRGLAVPGMPAGAPGMPGIAKGPIHVYYLDESPTPRVFATF